MVQYKTQITAIAQQARQVDPNECWFNAGLSDMSDKLTKILLFR